MSTELGVEEVASRLSLSEQRIRTMCREGILKSRQLGKTWLIDLDGIEDYESTSSRKNMADHVSTTKRIDKPVALSFFSGAMGLDQGIESEGFDIRLACEVDKYCRETISFNRPNIALIGDINKYCASDILEYAGLSREDDVDLIFGGPPCQAFSTAGNRKGFNDDRGNVFLRFLEIALDIRPKFIVIENVRGLLSCPMAHRPHEFRGDEFPDLNLDELPGGALNFVLSIISKAGYEYSFDLYNSANFGTPQVRERVVIICSRDGGKPPYLIPTHSKTGENGLPKWKTFKQATKDIQEHTHLNFPEKRLVYYRMLKPGEHWRNLPLDIQQEALGKSFFAGGGKTGFLRRLAWDKPSPTLVTHPAMPATDLAHPVELRPLSIEEYKKIQEFKDSWYLAGSLTEQYKQVGNAVPASLGRAIGKLIRRLINNEKVENTYGFEHSRYKFTSDGDWKKQFRKASEKSENVQPTLFS